jgi:hypothetical protein
MDNFEIVICLLTSESFVASIMMVALAGLSGWSLEQATFSEGAQNPHRECTASAGVGVASGKRGPAIAGVVSEGGNCDKACKARWQRMSAARDVRG